MKPSKQTNESLAKKGVDTPTISSNDPLNSPQPPEELNSSLRILLVDDSVDDQRIVKQLLNKCKESVKVHAVYDMASAFEELSLRQTDLVLLDYMLPNGVEGPEHISEMRNIAADPHLPIIVLTGFGNEKKATEAFKDGADDYYSKREMNPDDLLTAISSAIEHSIEARKSSQHEAQMMQNNNELKHKNQQMGSFYQTVSHELKTPLTGVVQHTQLILDEILGPISQKQKESLEAITTCCESLNRLMNDLIDTTEMERGTLNLFFEDYQLNEIAKTCIANNQFSAASKKIDLVLESSDDLPTVKCDPVRIEQVINNLINNALKYTTERGLIKLKLLADAAERSVSIVVKDNGSGMAQTELRSIFEKFYQAESDAEMGSHKGSLGLGLFICRKIVQLHQGEIHVRSELGKGSEFQVDLPLDSDDASS